MVKSRERFALGFVGGLIIVVAWLLGATYIHAKRIDLPSNIVDQLYPSPLQVMKAALDLQTTDVLWNAAISTMRVLMGFWFASIIAVPLGFVIGRISRVAAIAEPANDFLRYLPVAGFTTLTIFLIGTGNASAILIVFLGTVFHLTVAVADAARRVPHPYVDLARTMNLNTIETLGRVIVPAALPSIYDNLRVSVGWAWSYVTLAEVMGTSGGLGYAIEISRRYVRTDQVLFYMILIGLLGLISDQLMRRLGARLFRWTKGAPAL